MVVLRCRLIVHARTIDLRRVGIKIRTYENVRVFLRGTAGSKQHWASKEFEECINSNSPLTYFSGTKDRAFIAIHGDHIHVFSRNRSGKLMSLNHKTAVRELEKFINFLLSKGIKVEVQYNE